jgi:hypothetical protein
LTGICNLPKILRTFGQTEARRRDLVIETNEDDDNLLVSVTLARP